MVDSLLGCDIEVEKLFHGVEELKSVASDV